MNNAEAMALASDILSHIAPDADMGALRLDEDLREALDLDSMDFMRFVVELSQRTGLPIPDADTAKLRTLGGIADYLGAQG